MKAVGLRELKNRLAEYVRAVVASDLTLVECDRALIRAVARQHLTEAEAVGRRAHLNAAAARWQVMNIGPEVIERARRPLPGALIRTLDAIHLASALVARQAVADLGLLSLEDRIRAAGRQLGLRLQSAR